MKKIFISYRLDDSQEDINRLNANLCQYSQENNSEKLLASAADIPAGTNIHESLPNLIRDCEILLVIIGRNWLTATNEAGLQRLQDPLDVTRTEIETAFVFGVPVIPVLIEGTMLPLATQMPQSLNGLTTTMASPVRADPDFDDDVERLVERLNLYLKAPLRKENMSNSGQKSSFIHRFIKRMPSKSVTKASTSTRTIGLKHTAIFLTFAVLMGGIFAFQATAGHKSPVRGFAENSNAIPFVARTQQEPDVLSEIIGTVDINGDTLQLSTKSGVVEHNLEARGFVQQVRFGLAKKSYAFDRFKVISWAEPHSIKRWIDNDSTLILGSIDSTIQVPPPEFESESSADDSNPLKDYWLVLQIRLGDEEETNTFTAYAHSDRDIFSVN